MKSMDWGPMALTNALKSCSRDADVDEAVGAAEDSGDAAAADSDDEDVEDAVSSKEGRDGCSLEEMF